MKQKEYLKLVVDVTTLNTKLKLQQEQITEIVASCNEHLTAAEGQLSPIHTILQNLERSVASQELITAATVQKRTLLGLEKNLRSNVEIPIKNHLKHLTPLKEALLKFNEQLQSAGDDCEFDLTAVQEPFAQSQASLSSNEHELQSIMQHYMTLKETIYRYLQISSKLMLDQELEETTQKASILIHKITDLQHLIEETPGLLSQHTTQFTPLKQTLEVLTSQTKSLSLTQSIVPGATPILPQAPKLS